MIGIIIISILSWWLFPAHTYVTGEDHGKTCIMYKEPYRWSLQYKCL